MKNSKIVKVVLMMLIGIMLIAMTHEVLAADSYQDLADALNGGNNTSNSAATNNATNNTANTAGNNTSNTANTANTANTLNTSALRNTTNLSNTSSTTNNAYNNANLPKTGMAESIPVVALIVIFGISAAYAYKKVKDYRSL